MSVQQTDTGVVDVRCDRCHRVQMMEPVPGTDLTCLGVLGATLPVARGVPRLKVDLCQACCDALQAWFHVGAQH